MGCLRRLVPAGFVEVSKMLSKPVEVDLILFIASPSSDDLRLFDF
jgi:hypothetical protein